MAYSFLVPNYCDTIVSSHRRNHSLFLLLLTGTAETWDLPGSGKIETKSFENIVKESEKKNDTVAESMLGMGWTENSYDCYVNHYDDFSWNELTKETDTVPYWTALGWNETRWDGEMEYPDSEGKLWEELTAEEQQAAVALCYFDELWSYLNISEWEEYADGVTCGASPADKIASYNLTNETAAPSMEESPLATFDVDDVEAEEAAEVAAEEATEEEAFEKPVEKPVEEPIGEPDTVTIDTVEVLKTAEPTVKPTAPPTAEPTSTPYVGNPANRFLLWSWLYDVSKAAATTLGYDESTWNQPMTAAVESLIYDDLNANQIEATYVLGLAPKEIWNCFINHYQGFNWEELADAGVQELYMTLGWTDESWNALADPPASEGTNYESLTIEQQEAAQQLCYRKETWDKISLHDWVV